MRYTIYIIMFLLGFSFTASPEPEIEPTYTQHSVKLSDGTTLAYYERSGEGPTLILVPGSWGDYRVYDETVKALSPELHIVIIEMRGHGKSQPATLYGSIELFADDVLRVAEAMKLKRFYVGGHSIGGMIAVELAGREHDALAGVISIEGWTYYTVQREAFNGATKNTLTPEQETQRLANRARVLDHLTKEESSHFGSLWRKWDGWPILESTDVPVLELWGDRGREAPSRAVMRIPDRPNIELVWMEGASHSLLIECPAKVAQSINAFISKTESADQK